MMMQLYYSSISNYCSKVNLLIEYKKIDIEFLPPNMGNVDSKSIAILFNICY